jgi:hypothetical protein
MLVIKVSGSKYLLNFVAIKVIHWFEDAQDYYWQMEFCSQRQNTKEKNVGVGSNAVPRKAPNTMVIFRIPSRIPSPECTSHKNQSEICPAVAAPDRLIDGNNSVRKAFAQIKT